MILRRPVIFHPNRIKPGGVIDFSRWRPRRRKSSSGFGFNNGMSAIIKRHSSICKPNFHDILYQSADEALILPVSETNDRHIEILLLLSILIFLSSSAWYFESAHQISSKLNKTQRSYDVISIFQDPTLFTEQISMISESAAEMYYFRFLKTNHCHIGILLLVCTISPGFVDGC